MFLKHTEFLKSFPTFYSDTAARTVKSKLKTIAHGPSPDKSYYEIRCERCAAAELHEKAVTCCNVKLNLGLPCEMRDAAFWPRTSAWMTASFSHVRWPDTCEWTQLHSALLPCAESCRNTARHSHTSWSEPSKRKTYPARPLWSPHTLGSGCLCDAGRCGYTICTGQFQPGEGFRNDTLGSNLSKYVTVSAGTSVKQPS